MPSPKGTQISRRAFNRMATGFGLGAFGAGLLPSAGLAQATDTGLVDDTAPASNIERRVSGFFTHEWQDHFDNLRKGAVLVDTSARALQFWPEDGSFFRIYPTSVPLTEEMTRRGRTTIVQKRVGPDWRPTPAMLQRNPDLPDYVGPGPENPLGTHALYLGWTYYRIHGTNDTRKIGRQSSNGCIGLYNEQIAELFDMTVVGTQVKVI